mmetsp:Transcript_57681/g.163812  ORF Transcript_57681/g.163812 Transcript_57681/m.163812 type:complete len:146 (-) Transcript_57681:84-521(-)
MACCCASADGNEDIVAKDTAPLGLSLKAFDDPVEERGPVDDRKVSDEFTVTIDKVTQDGKLGLDTSLNRKRAGLRIHKIKEDGLMIEWNTGHPDAAVRPGDVLVEVNGVRDPPKLLYDQIAQDIKLNLVFRRGPPTQSKDEIPQA